MRPELRLDQPAENFVDDVELLAKRIDARGERGRAIARLARVDRAVDTCKLCFVRKLGFGMLAGSQG